MMDGIITAALMVLFIGVALWAYSPRQKSRFREAEVLPLIDDQATTGDES